MIISETQISLLKAIPPTFTKNLDEYVTITAGDNPTIYVEGFNFDASLWSYNDTTLPSTSVDELQLNIFTDGAITSQVCAKPSADKRR